MEAHPLVVVVPAWNEADSIAAVVRGALPHGQVVVVDDRSTDATAEVAGLAGAVVARHSANLGYDGALNTGFATALGLGASWIVTMDADGSHDPSAIPMLGEALWSGMAVVVGTRPSNDRFSERLFGFWTRFAWGIPDPLCGMKAYRADLLTRFGVFDRYQSIGTDLLLRVLRAGLPTAHRAVPCHSRTTGISRFGSGWNANKRILRSMSKGMLEGAPRAHRREAGPV